MHEPPSHNGAPVHVSPSAGIGDNVFVATDNLALLLLKHVGGVTLMKTKDELQPLIDKIASDASPVGMDAVYVHALILDKLEEIQRRLTALEQARNESTSGGSA